MQQFFKYLALMLFVSLFTACGGGGGSAGAPGGGLNPATFLVNAPNTLTLAIGQKATFPVSGGQTPYITSSSAPGIAVSSIQDAGLTITGIKAGSADIRVTPTGGGADFSMSVTVVSSVTLFAVQSPETVTLSIGNSGSYTLLGGLPPYKTASSDASVLKAEIVGTELKLTGLKKGSASVDVYDSVSAVPITKSVTVVDVTPFYTTAPTSGVTLEKDATLTYAVGGGVASYSVVSNNAAVVDANISGATLALKGGNIGSASVILRDAAGSSITVPVTVAVSTILTTSAPTSLTLESSSSRSFEVRGGSGYSAQSSNSSVVTAAISPTTSSDTKATLTMVAVANGTASVLVADSIGRSITIAVTVVGSSTVGSVASVDVTADKLSVRSAGEEATITAFVKNSTNVAMPDVPIVFSATSGTLLSADSKTDASGVARVKLSPGSDKTNRSITVTATAGTKSGAVNVAISGSSLSITGSSTQQLGATSSYSVRAVDSAGNPLAGVSVAVTSKLGNSFLPATSTTDASGNATFTYTATKSGDDKLTVTGPGTMSQTMDVTISAVNLSFTTPVSNKSVNVNTSEPVTVRYSVDGVAQVGKAVNFSSTRGLVSIASVQTNATGEASVTVSSSTAGPATITAQIAGVGTVTLPVTFVATTPSTITLQATPSAIPPNQTGTTNQSTLSAVVRDVSGNLVANQTVNFNLVSDLSGGSLSAGTALTDANGRAQVQFISGATSTPANGVRVQATVAGLSSTANLTVSGSALFISFGISNEISNLDSTTYTKRFSVYVTDANGVAVGNQVVSLSVIPNNYRKGTLTKGATHWGLSAGSFVTCPNEDSNQNGILDKVPSNEDTNNNGQLTPGNVVVASPGIVTTDSAGRASFDLQYGEHYAPWVDVRISARAAVAGTESIAATDFALVGLDSDFVITNTPAGVNSPFGTVITTISGVAPCANPN